MIEEETPKELKCNIKLWKQREAEASHKHMLALKKMANQVEHELGQLYKEQWPQEELNVAIKRNRQSCNTLSSYQHMRVVGLSGDTRHEQRGTPGAPQDSAPFQREQSVPLTEGQGILDQSEAIVPFNTSGN
jgi:seryl-tRNA(Sec) selenium transferase